MNSAQPVPWVYTDDENLLAWMWVTDHFICRILGYRVAGDGDEFFVRQHHWELADRIVTHDGVPRVIAEGNTRTFGESEATLKEHVAKAYPGHAEYRVFVGDAGMRFELSTGEMVDVANYVGCPVTVRVLTESNLERVISGDFDVVGYRWRLATRDSIFEVLPAHVVHIGLSAQSAHRSPITRFDESYTGIGRIYARNPSPGCTGRPGFRPHSVDHAGAPKCPVHESEMPDHLIA